MRESRIGLTATAVLLLSGCAGGSVAGDGAAAVGGGPADCAGTRFDPSALAQAPDASTLPPGPAGAVDDMGDPAFDPADGWKVVYLDDARADLIRELDTPEQVDPGDVRTHAVIRVERIRGATNVPDGTWMLSLAGTCTPRVVTGDAGRLGEADLTLPSEPDPTAAVLDLLVWERACASGRPADGRVVLVSLEETDDQVRVHVGVRPVEGDATCPGNPPTPFSVPLEQPLGDRQVVDVSVVPARPVPVDDGREEPNPPNAGVSDEDVEAALSWQPPASYVLRLETVCPACRDNLKRIVVTDGEVTERVAVDETGEVIREADADEAPSLQELLDRLRAVWAETPSGVLEVTIGPDGQPAMIDLDLDPDPTDDAGRTGFVILDITPTG